MKRLNISVLLIFILLSPACLAAIRLPYFFGSDMVLQQKTNAAIWGWSSARARISITTSWNNKRYVFEADKDGKWKGLIATPAAGGPYQVTISDGSPVILRNVMIGEVWLCSGQSNMEMPLKGYRDQPILGSNEEVFNAANDQVRLYTVPRSVKLSPQDTTKHSTWKIALPETAANFSATGWYFGKMLYQRLRVPIGLINISYGGSPVEAFMSAEALKEFPEIKIPTAAESATANNKNATTLYNGMIKPFMGFTIAGCIWYQGESNNGRPDQYERLFPAMIAQWRKEFAIGNFPFYYAQIAPFVYSSFPPEPGNKNNSAYLRDAQRKALENIPESGMVVLMDIGEDYNIHPADKATGGKRFAYLALAKTYGQKGFAYTSPAFDSIAVNGSIVTVKFREAPNGLTSFGKPLMHFEIAGADKYYRPAKAVISRGTVLVSSPEVPNPVAVRYAFKDFVIGDLFSTEGFPVSSFRTDNW